MDKKGIECEKVQNRTICLSNSPLFVLLEDDVKGRPDNEAELRPGNRQATQGIRSTELSKLDSYSVSTKLMTRVSVIKETERI